MAMSSACVDPALEDVASEASIWRLVSKRASEIVAITPGGRSPAFYCIHSVAGDVTGYFELARLLGPDVTFYGIQVPKSDMVARSVQTIEIMADRYVRALTKFQPKGPLIIGGFSAGAIIALDVAQKLRALGRDVPLLVALDGAPNNTNAGLKPWALTYQYHLARNAISAIKDIRAQDTSYRRLARRLFDRLVCRTHFKIPLFRNSQTLDISAMLNVFDRPGWQTEYKLFMRAMYDAMYAYVPTPYSGHVVVYELERQPLFQLRQVGAVWKHLASDCEIVRLGGRHGEFFVADTLGPMVAHLRQALHRSGGSREFVKDVAEPKAVVAHPEARFGGALGLSEST